jgi:hypothetical protein
MSACGKGWAVPGSLPHTVDLIWMVTQSWRVSWMQLAHHTLLTAKQSVTAPCWQTLLNQALTAMRMQPLVRLIHTQTKATPVRMGPRTQ